jgi:hypothetical protein
MRLPLEVIGRRVLQQFNHVIITWRKRKKLKIYFRDPAKNNVET